LRIILDHVAAFTTGRFFDFLFQQLSMKKRVSFRDSLDRRRFSISGHRREGGDELGHRATNCKPHYPRHRGFLFASRSFPPSIFYFAFLFLSCSLFAVSSFRLRGTHAYVYYIREVTLLQRTLDRELLDASSRFLARKSGGIMSTA